MVSKLLAVVVILGLFLWGSHAIGGPNMQEGLWEITARLEMPGMPSSMPSVTHTYTQCITKEDLVPQASWVVEQGQQRCELKKRVEEDTVYWTLRCHTEQGTTVVDGRVTYMGKTFEGEMRIKTPEGMEVIQHISGRRIGDCK